MGPSMSRFFSLNLLPDQLSRCSGQGCPETFMLRFLYNCGEVSLHQWVELITHTLAYDWELVSIPGSVAHAARPLVPLMPSWQPVIMDLSKLKVELGYREVVPLEEALPRTVCWSVAHPPARGGDLEHHLHD